MAKMFNHNQLVEAGAKWLKNIGCKVVFKELRTYSSETPDVIGWRDGRSILIECKTSRIDLLKDKKKWFREYHEDGMGDWRVYLCEPGIIEPKDIPELWSLVYVNKKGFKRVCNLPKNNTGWWKRPFKGNSVSEIRMLVSALRRIEAHGLLDKIYEKVES